MHETNDKYRDKLSVGVACSSSEIIKTVLSPTSSVRFMASDVTGCYSPTSILHNSKYMHFSCRCAFDTLFEDLSMHVVVSLQVVCYIYNVYATYMLHMYQN